MIIGLLKEIMDNENRVALTPEAVGVLVNENHAVYVEKSAGVGSGFGDSCYKKHGAVIYNTPQEVYQRADLVLKVKELLPVEYSLLRECQVIFTYLHLASNPEQAKALIQSKAIGIAYETVELPDGSLPLLAPMSEIAGKMSVQIGAKYLEKLYGGKGLLLGGIPGVPPATVVIVGGGIAGTNAAKVASGMGARVIILEKDPRRLRQLDDLFGDRVETMLSSTYTLAEAIVKADLLIGAVLLPGVKNTYLITEEMVKTMKKGAVLIDLSPNQGNFCETMDQVASYSNPVYKKHDVIHYCVSNIPGNVPQTATTALACNTLPYILKIANFGWREAIKKDKSLAKGFNVVNGKITNQVVASALGLEYYSLEKALKAK